MKPFLSITQLGIPINTKDPNELRFNCIYCDDQSYHLYVHIKKRVFHCFKCGTSGRTNMDGPAVDSLLYPLKKDKALESTAIRLPPKHKDTITPAAEKYLLSRGIYESDCATHKIYCAAAGSIYFGRIIIPYNPQQGWADYWVGRSYTRIGFPKYVNPKAGNKRLFSNTHSTRWRDLWGAHELCIVEGPFDFLKASRHGPTLALLGQSLSNQIAREIITRYSKAYILLDTGTKEMVSSMKIAMKLRPHIEVQILKCPKKDPGEMIDSDFEELFNV